MNKNIKYTFMLALFLVMAGNVFSAKRYWISGTTANWNTTANWSATSGGGGGSSVPGSSDTAYFDGSALGRCDIDANVNVKRFEIKSGYTDTITQNAHTITIGSSGMILANGVFIGSSSSVTIVGDYNNSGCNFTSTSGTLDVQRGDFLLTGAGSFSHNNGTVKFSYAVSSGTVDTCNLTITGPSTNTFYDLNLNTASSGTTQRFIFSSGNKLIVTHNLLADGSGNKILHIGTLEVQGNVTISTGNFGSGGSPNGLLKFTGSSPQSLSQSFSAVGDYLPYTEIAKTGDTLKFISDISTKRNVTLTAGNIDAGTSKFYINNSGDVTYSGNFTGHNAFYKVAFVGFSYPYSLTINDTLEVSDSLINDKQTYWDKGTGAGILNAKGTIYQNESLSGTATLMISGSGTQTIKSTGFSVPHLKIVKGSDTLSLLSNIGVQGRFDYVSGFLKCNTHKVSFSGNATTIITGMPEIAKVNVNYSFSPGYYLTVGSGSELTVTDTLWISGIYYGGIQTGIINAKGHVIITNTSTAAGTGGSGTLKINGTGNQDFVGGSLATCASLPNIVLKKSAGTLNLSGYINVYGNWTDSITGSASLNAGTSHISMLEASQTITESNPLSSVHFKASTTIPSGTTLTVNDTLFIAGGSNNVTLSTGTIEAKGDIKISNSSSLGGGTATILINGSGIQNLTGNSTAGTGNLPKVTINKSTGTLNLSGVISTKNNWTYTAGTVSVGTSTVVICATSTVTPGSLEFNGFTLAPAAAATVTIASGNTVTVNGTFATTGTVNAVLNGTTLNAKGDISLGNTATGSGGTTLIKINGTGTQTLTGNSTVGAGPLSNITISKTSTDTLKLSGTISVKNGWTYTSGIINAGSSTLVPVGTCTLSGKQKLYNITLPGTSTSTVTISSGDTITSNGTLTIQGANSIIVNTGVLRARGDISVTNTSTVTTSGGTATILIDSTLNQTLTGNGVANSGYLPKIKINKTGGTLYLASQISPRQDWTYVAGTVDAITNSSVIWFNGTFNLDPQGSSETMMFNKVFCAGSSVRTLTGNLKMHDKITINAGSTLASSGYSMTLRGDWFNNGTWTPGGSAVILDSNRYQSINKASSALETFTKFTLNKSGGSLTLNTPVKVTDTLKLTKGKIKTSSSNYLEFAAGSSYSGGSDSAYVHGPLRKTGNTAFTFPVGDTTLLTGAYHPFAITAPSSASDQFEVLYQASGQTLGSAIDDSLVNLSTCENWKITQNVGTSSVTPTISWNSNWCNPNLNYYDMRVAEWNSSTSAWENQGNATYTVTGSLGTLKAGYSTSAGSGGKYYTSAHKKKSLTYAELAFKPNGTYYKADGNYVRFKYTEEYKDLNGALNLKVYRLKDNKIVYSNSSSYNIMFGHNQVDFDLTKLTGGVATGYYMLVVTNDKSENFYLKFKI